MKLYAALFFLVLFSSCNNDTDDTNNNDNGGPRDYREDMRDFVIGISQQAKAAHPGFAVIPQNGIELVSTNGNPSGSLHTAYLDAIDGHGQEDLWYGYNNDNQATPAQETAYIKEFLDVSKAAGNSILVTDYCWSPAKVADSYAVNEASGYISFAATERDLNVIPDGPPHNENNTVVTSLEQAKNFLYLINPENFNTKAAFIDAVTATNYDIVIMDLFLNDEMFTAAEVSELRNKANGGKRMVICYMSIGEAEDYRYYWNNSWNSNKPSWMAAENPDWEGNYKVRYWDDDWQAIIYGTGDSYLSRILDADFDGVYLDIIDAYEYFE